MMMVLAKHTSATKSCQIAFKSYARPLAEHAKSLDGCAICQLAAHGAVNDPNAIEILDIDLVFIRFDAVGPSSLSF